MILLPSLPPNLMGGDRLGRRLPSAGRFLAGVLAGLLAGAAAHANPTDPTVVHGSAHFARPGANALDVTTSPNAIIHWQGFSIGAGETTRFLQPSASSAVLNRVTGADPSAILGQLLSNGRVFLVNPQGIVFGEGAVVDTAGLVASTLGIADADFLAGRYRFDAAPGAGNVVNRGRIEAGAGGVFLLAPSVENSGVVRTAGGDLVLAAGRRITLTSLDLDGVRVEVQAPEDEALNLGSLAAERGAAGMFARSIRNAGTVEANAVTMDEHGTVRLVARDDLTLEAGGRVAAGGPSGGEVHVESKRGTTWVSGEVSARGREGRGGHIRLLGNRVGLAGARVDASGPAVGGEVLAGGDVKGQGPTPTAEAAYVSADSTVSADALASGDGGKVVVFARGFANVQGRLSARGGPAGGDGGFVETSGLESFAIHRTPDTAAPAGKGGHWLIDPHDIEIVAGSGNTNIPAADPFTSTGDSARLGIDLLTAALSGGQSVTVQTAAGGSQGGNITLSTALDVEDTTGTNTLTLQAHRHVNINAPVSDAAGGANLNLVLDAGNRGAGGVVVGSELTLRGGSLRTDGDFVVIENGAVVTVDGVRWEMNADTLLISDSVGRVGDGTVIVRNRGTIDATGKGVLVGDDPTGGVGTLIIESGAEVRTRRVIVGDGAGSQGTVTVTGAGSTLVTAGADNEVLVGDEGTGTLEVLDGGLVDTLKFDVGRSGVGRATIRGVASDGTRSRVIVSPDNGRFSDDPETPGCCADQGGFVRAGRNAGSRGTIEILGGGLLRVRDGGGTWNPGFTLARNKGSVGTLLIDGSGSSLEVIQTAPANSSNPLLGSGPYVWLGRRGGGTTTIRNGGRLLVRGESAWAGVSRGGDVNPDFPDSDTGPVNQRSVVNVLSGGRMEVAGEGALLEIGTGGPSADGAVSVSGPGSRIATAGTDSGIFVGDEGTGVLEVLDGGLVETLWFDVGRTGVGRATIRGVASDGTRSRVIVSPANGKFSGDFVDEGGFARAGRNAGSRGAIEILAGALLRVLDGGDTHGPEFQLARHKGSVGTLLIDGAGSSLEVIQRGPAMPGDPNVQSGPTALLGRRGGGTTAIRNGGRLLVQGEDAFAGISQDSVHPNYPDPDAGPITQRSVVDVLSGGRMEITGEGARFTIGQGGPAADGVVTVTGAGSAITVAGDGNALVAGDEGTGALTIEGGAGVRAARIVVGRKPGSRGTLRVGRDGSLDVAILLAVGKDFDFDRLAVLEPGGTGSATGEPGSRVRYGALDVGAGGSTDFTAAADPEVREDPEVQENPEVQESVGENTDAILVVQRQEPSLEAADERFGPAGEQGGTQQRAAGEDDAQAAGEDDAQAGEEDGARDEDGEEGEEDEDSEEEDGELSGVGEDEREEREELPMCPA